jgi:hypothetical protein
MGVLSKMFGGFSSRGKATALYKRGMQRASDRDLEGAIADYTEVVEMGKAPPDLKAMALMNRALAYSRVGDDEKAHADLDKVLAMPDAGAQVKAAATEKLHRMKRRVGKHDEGDR